MVATVENDPDVGNSAVIYVKNRKLYTVITTFKYKDYKRAIDFAKKHRAYVEIA